ncbi:MAG TPA: nuclear transport factor 2 family protein [Polyangiaceae bacterium]|nr:nuclear transport factor 2 family protein [Polyangiaceae bacterium]
MVLGSNHGRRRWRARPIARAVAYAALLISGCGEDDSSLGTSVYELSPQEEANVAVATRVLEEGLIGGDVSVIEELVRPDYIQHNAQARDGREGLLELVATLQAQGGASVQIHRVLADDDYVAFHSTYGEGDARLVAFDVFRLEQGQLAEHWDAFTQWVDPAATVSGNTLVDGTETVRDRNLTEDNRELVTSMVREVFEEGRVERLADYIGSSYIQHNPNAGNGLRSTQAFFVAVKAQGVPLAYTASPLVVADGNFVLVGSEGYLGRLQGEAANPDMGPFAYTVFYDLFRVNGGKIVEHWDVIQRVDPASVPHANGLF